MNVKIYPSKLQGTIKVPTSKSYSIRAIFVALLARDVSIIHNINLCDDVLASIDCIKEAKAYITYIYVDDHIDLVIDSRTLIESGSLLKLNCRNSATVLRLCIPVFLSLGYKLIVIGTKRLLKRGIDEYTNAFGITFTPYGEEGLYVNGNLNYGSITINASNTSQFLSGALIAYPNLDGTSVINTIGKVVSQSYIAIALDVLEKAGINILYEDYKKFIVNGMQDYDYIDLDVEGDESLAAYFGLLNECGMDVDVINTNPSTIQADRAYRTLFNQMKKEFVEIDLANIIDLAPILFVAAGLFNGARFKNHERLSLKESNRVDDVLAELVKFGYKYSFEGEYLTINKSKIHPSKETLCVHEDHRIVMSLSVLCMLYGGVIEKVDCVNKSYPNFFNDLVNLGAKIESGDII